MLSMINCFTPICLENAVPKVLISKYSGSKVSMPRPRLRSLLFKFCYFVINKRSHQKLENRLFLTMNIPFIYYILYRIKSNFVGLWTRHESFCLVLTDSPDQRQGYRWGIIIVWKILLSFTSSSFELMVKHLLIAVNFRYLHEYCW